MAAATNTADVFGRSWPRSHFPKVIVFDVDYTLWPYWVDTHTQPPYKLDGRGRIVDGCGKEMKLFPEVAGVLCALRQVPELQIAFASRTGEPQWLEQLSRLLPVGSRSLMRIEFCPLK